MNNNQDLFDNTTETKLIETYFDEKTNCVIKKGKYFLIVKGI
jgi:hypothetical protein